MKILLDPGHGIPHTGAKGSILGIEERIVVLRVAFVLKSWLEAHGDTVYLTRNTDLCVIKSDRAADLRARGAMAARLQVHCMLSIHGNSVADPRVSGYECFTLPGQDASDLFADELLKSYRASFPNMRLRADLRDGDLDKEMDLLVLKSAPKALPKALFELAFLSNPAEEKWLGNPNNYPAIAAALGRGIQNWGRAAL